MKRMFALAFAAVLMLSVFIAAQSRNAAEEFKAAQHKETVEGDVPGAIDAYNKIANGKDHEFAAKALIALGDVLRKSKDAEARKKYLQVIKDFPEQKDAVKLAQDRLEGLAATSAPPTPLFKTQTQLLSQNPSLMAIGVSPEGHLLARYSSLKVLVEVDAVTGRYEQLGEIGNTRSFAFSSDGQHIAFGRMSDGNGAFQLDVLNRRVPTTGTGGARYLNPSQRMVFRGPSYIDIQAFGWSSDDKEIFVVLTDRDYSHRIAVISTLEGGALRTIKDLDWREPENLSLSPDGRYIAYDAPVAKQSANRDIFLVSTGGGAERAIVQDSARDSLPVWTPDGGSIVFTSDRSGSLGLWTVGLSDGKPRGAPRQLTANERPLWPLGFSRDGSFYYRTVPVALRSEIHTGVLQSDRTDAVPIRPSTTPLATNARGRNENPEFSPDGKLLAYFASRSPAFMEGNSDTIESAANSITVVVRSLESGTERPFSTGLTNVTGLRWSADGRALRFEGRTGLTSPYSSRRIDLQTGTQTDNDIPNLGKVSGVPCVSPDGKRIYFGRPSASVSNRVGTTTFIPADVIAYDVETKRETVLGTFQGAGFPDCRRFLSSDGNHILVFSTDDEEAEQRLQQRRASSTRGAAPRVGPRWVYMIPTAGGPPVKMSLPSSPVCIVQWSWDRKEVLLTPTSCGPVGPQDLGGGKLLRIHEGSAPVEVGAVPAADTVTPDGKQFAYTVPTTSIFSSVQTWVVPDLLQSDGKSHGLFLVDFDPLGGKVRGSSTRLPITPSLTGFEGAPAWSPNGESIAFKREREESGWLKNGELVTFSLKTGIETTHPQWDAKKVLARQQRLAWLRDGGLVMVSPKMGPPNDALLLREDMKSGRFQEISLSFIPGPMPPVFAVSPDDKTLYSSGRGNPNPQNVNGDVNIVAVDLASGRLGAAFTLPPDVSTILGMDLSRDGRTFVMRPLLARTDPTTGKLRAATEDARIFRIQTDGTGYREIYRGRSSQGIQGLSEVRWTKDGKAVLAAEQVDGETWQIIRIPAEGGAEPVSIGLRITSRVPVQFDLSPDGTRIVFSGAAATITPAGTR